MQTQIRKLIKWIKANVVTSELNFDAMWDALPDEGVADIHSFDEWMLTVTKDMSPEGFDELQEKIKAHLRQREDEEGKEDEEDAFLDEAAKNASSAALEASQALPPSEALAA